MILTGFGSALIRQRSHREIISLPKPGLYPLPYKGRIVGCSSNPKKYHQHYLIRQGIGWFGKLAFSIWGTVASL
ncbi:Uncharacterized protein HZ326_13935 [Fusarium oxysporum f. sp. albedinis]|nr:Uncharacterized protein HZ326_13935 [Fusarium oxysporum f. sp. albedinis]